MRPILASCTINALLLVATIATSARAQLSLPNLGFDSTAVNGRPAGWGTGGKGYEVTVDSVAPLAGRYSLRSRWAEDAPYSPGAGKFGVANHVVPLERAVGRRLHLTGYIRTDSISAGYAGFWMRVDGPGRAIFAFDNMATRGPRGTTPWTRYDIELPVDSGAVAVIFGVLHPGDGTAWFDSLTLDVVGPPMPRAAAAVPVEPRPAEDMTRLLTDAELALPPDSIVVPEEPRYTEWMQSHAHPIRSLGAIDFSDLRFLAPLLAGKRIVQLGESGHGVAEFNLAKVRLIRYLHEELGYDVMAFESSLFACDRAQKAMATLEPIDLMRACIFGVWHASETLPLFEYIKQTQSTAHPLVLAGFDAQTSAQMDLTRPAVFRQVLAPLDSSFGRHVHQVDSAFGANPTPSYAVANQARLVAFYDSLAAFLRTNQRAIEATHRDDPSVAIVTRQAAVSMSQYVRQLAQSAGNTGTEIRDRAMANNLDVLLDELHPGKKVIVWAHNFHVQHREHPRDSLPAGSDALRTMGTWVAERHRTELYTVGLFMYRGTATLNNRRPYRIVQSRSGSLESILHRSPWRYSYVDLSLATRAAGNDWMWKRIDGLSWGTQVERFVPRDEYDGLLFIDTVHPPNYR